jgi:hypothetical protein
MIAFKSKEGVEIDIETNNDPVEVDRFLTQVLQPETYDKMKRQLPTGEEIFFEFTGANKEELPRVRHCLVHLDRKSRSTGLSRGSFYVIFHVHKDSLPVAQAMAKTLKSGFKNRNDWNDTTEHGIPSDKFFAIPPMDLK